MRFSELEGARVGVWGAGREIRSFAAQLSRRLKRARIEVLALDEAPPAGLLEELALHHAQLAVGSQALTALAGCEVVVRSPGVSIHKPELIELRSRGVPVTTATSLWLAEHGARGVIAVTGTKGKSTTAAIAHHLARAAGVPAQLAGNIGLPALDLLDADSSALVVLELSSYQVADLASGAETVIFTNLYREHLDWHGSERAYREEKLRILDMPEVSTAVLPARQRELAERPLAARRVLFGQPAGWDVGEAGVTRAGELRLAAEDLPLPGEHNALNVCAAASALEAVGIELPPLAGALSDFHGLPHRLQVIAASGGVTWVNDSISTTPESTFAALESFPGRPLVLLAGGQDRGQDYGGLAHELARLQATVIGMPTTGERLLAEARGAGLSSEHALAAADLQDAVRLAREHAEHGAVVLLSPAAPSYDRFRNFEERGERFRTLVQVT